MNRTILLLIFVMAISGVYAQKKGDRYVCVNDNAQLLNENYSNFVLVKEGAGLNGSYIKYLGMKKDDSIYVEIYAGLFTRWTFPTSKNQPMVLNSDVGDVVLSEVRVNTPTLDPATNPWREESYAKVHYENWVYSNEKNEIRGWMKITDLRARCPKCDGFPVKKNFTRTKIRTCKYCDGKGYLEDI